MWITCFDKLMPEARHAPWKYLPRPGACLSVTFGTPVPPAVVRGAFGTVTRDEDVPGEAEQQQRKDREAHCTHGCRTACRGGAWAAGVWRSAR